MRVREEGAVNQAPPLEEAATTAPNHSQKEEPEPSQIVHISKRSKAKRKWKPEAEAVAATVSKDIKQPKLQHLPIPCNELKQDPTNQSRDDSSVLEADISGAPLPIRRRARLPISGAVVTPAWDVTAAAAALVCLHSRTNCPANGQPAVSLAMQCVGNIQARSLHAPAPALFSSSLQARTVDSSVKASSKPTSKPIQKRSQDATRPSNSISALKVSQVAPAPALKIFKSKAVSSKKPGSEQTRCKCGELPPPTLFSYPSQWYPQVPCLTPALAQADQISEVSNLNDSEFN